MDRQTPSRPSSIPIIFVAVLALVALSCRTLHAQQLRPTTHKVPPVYPPIAKQMHITGVVVVAVTVDAAGAVTKAESTTGNKLLAGPALEAVKQWKFAPGDASSTFPVDVRFE